MTSPDDLEEGKPASAAGTEEVDCSMMMMNTAWLRLLASFSLVAPMARAVAPRSISVYT